MGSLCADPKIDIKMNRTMYKEAVVTLILLVSMLLVACSDDDTTGPVDREVPTVQAQYTFALPKTIMGSQQQTTRMTPEVVQEDEDEAHFRGIDDIYLLCFDRYPTQNTSMIGNAIELKSSDGEDFDGSDDADYSMTQEIRIPVGTSYFTFYGRAADSPSTHEERMHFGTSEKVGLGSSYTDNSSIRFRPVPICTSTDELGGSSKGHALLNLLNELISITGPEAAPNDKWATVNNIYLYEAYQTLTALRTLSSFNVQHVLGSINQLVNMEGPDDQGKQLAAAITAKIASCCDEVPAPNSNVIKLKAEYMGFPDDLHLPAGAARVIWNATTERFEVPDVQAYGKQLDILSLNDYVYPQNLQYQVISDILTSDAFVNLSEVAAAGKANDPQIIQSDPTAPATIPYDSWRDLLDHAYVEPKTVVQSNTQSVAMVQQVQYAVGRLGLRVRISTDNIYDAKGKVVDVSQGFKLKGYIVGGQREVDYNYRPVAGSTHEYAIYDTDLATGSQDVKRHTWSEFNYILGLSTSPDKDVYLALELENNGDDFYGADGLIVHGATFYLVAAMVPSEGSNYSAGQLDQIFNKDFATKVNLTILGGWPDKDGDGKPDPDLDSGGNPLPLTGLATATYGLPDTQIPHPMLGVNVDLIWGDGPYFEDIPLGIKNKK